MVQGKRQPRYGERVTRWTYRTFQIETRTLRPFGDWERHTVWCEDWKINYQSFRTQEEAMAFVDGMLHPAKPWPDDWASLTPRSY